MTEEIRF